VSAVRPFEARELPTLPHSHALQLALHDLIVAVNGAPNAHPAVRAVVDAVRWLRAHPEHAAILLNPSQESEVT
jgi:hypothetical protein